jgi:hypothetical protein
MMECSHPGVLPYSARHRARVVLLAFALTFILSRIVTFLILVRRIPNIHLHLGGTHVHHLTYGIFLLAGVGAFLLFAPVSPRQMDRAGAIYGVGLALTFDEFGLWLHLDGDYWRRGSFDAVIVLASLLGLVSFAPPLRSWRPHHVATALLTLVATLVYFLLMAESFRFAAREQPRLERLEKSAPR